jgi:hypothetical protein
VVPAGGEAAVLVHVLLDDAAPFKDMLHVLVSEGADINVSLTATGVGNTVVSSVLAQPWLDFGAQFVGRPWQQEVEVANQGRRAVTLTWTNKRLTEVLDALNKAAKAAGGCLDCHPQGTTDPGRPLGPPTDLPTRCTHPPGKKVEASQLSPEQQPVFSITPAKVLLPAKESTSFLITGVSSKAGARGVGIKEACRACRLRPEALPRV